MLFDFISPRVIQHIWPYLCVKNVGAVAKRVDGINHCALVAKHGRISLGLAQILKTLNCAAKPAPANAGKLYSGFEAELFMWVGKVHFGSSCATKQYKHFRTDVNREVTHGTR